MSDNEHLSERTDRIRQLNDQLRRTGKGGQIVATGALTQADPELIYQASVQVRDYAAFDTGDDPYGEHDFGSFVIGGQKFHWKIDYYDRSMEFGADDPADSANCVRVLSIFYAEDY